MKTPFRQGLIAYQRDGLGNPQYLLPSTTPGYVALNVSPTPTSVAIAHGSSDYLLVFSQTIAAAWGPIPAGVTSHLYWDVDLLTSSVTFGFTTVEPVLSSIEPLTPQVNQHWFDLASMKMKVWSGERWYEKVRAFAGKVPNGSITSLTPADSEPYFAPWKNAVALQVEGNPGYIATDVFGTPIRTPAGEFVTTRTPVRFNNTVGTTGVLAVLPNAFIPVRASENIPRMSLVYFSGEDTVGLASGNPAADPPRIPIGIVQEELFSNEVGVVTQSGEITYDQWDWSADIGKPLYCGDSGEVVTVRPNGLLAYRVGFVKNANTIVFQIDAETQPQIYQASSNDVIVNGTSPISTSFVTSPLNERIWTVEIQPASDTQNGYMSAAQAAQLIDVDARLSQAEVDITGKSDIGHTHAISDVSGLQLVLDGKSDVGHTHSQYALTTHNHNLDYAPIVHSHTIPDVASLQDELNARANRVHVNTFDEVFDGVDRSGAIDIGTGDSLRTVLGTKMEVVPTAVDDSIAIFLNGSVVDSGFTTADFAPVSHLHAISDVIDLQLTLNGKANVVHGHAISDITGLQLALDGKADTVHTHAISDITGLQLALDGKADTVHTHAISDITGLQLALDGKANVAHTHVASDITGGTAGFVLTSNGTNAFWSAPFTIGSIDQHTDVDTTTIPPVLNNVLQWNGLQWVPGTVAGGGSITVPGDLRQILMSDGAGDLQVLDLRTDDYFDIFNGSRLIIGYSGSEGAVVEPRGFLDGETVPGSNMGSMLIRAQSNYDPFGLPIPGSPFSSKHGGRLFIQAGDTGYDTALGGSIVIRAGESVGASSLGGSVVIAAGRSDLITTGGHSAVFIGSQDSQEGGGGWMVVNSYGAVGFTGGSGIFLSDADSSQLADKSQNDTDWGQPGMYMRGAGQSYRPSWEKPEFKPEPLQTVNTATVFDVGSSRHHNWHVRVNSPSNVTYTVQPDSFWSGGQEYWEDGFDPTSPGPMPSGGVILFGKHGAGDVILQAGPGVTINTPETLTLSKLNGKITLIKVGTNTWDVEGNLEPA